MWRITDKFNPHKVWIIKKYKCGHYFWNQEICGRKQNTMFVRTSKRFIKDVLSWIKEEELMAKTREVKVIQGNYGYGWDDLCEYEKHEYGELKADFKAYEENEAYPHRIITRRIPNKED